MSTRSSKKSRCSIASRGASRGSSSIQLGSHLGRNFGHSLLGWSPKADQGQASLTWPASSRSWQHHDAVQEGPRLPLLPKQNQIFSPSAGQRWHSNGPTDKIRAVETWVKGFLVKTRTLPRFSSRTTRTLSYHRLHTIPTIRNVLLCCGHRSLLTTAQGKTNSHFGGSV